MLDFVRGEEFPFSAPISFSKSFHGWGFAISSVASADVRPQSETWGLRAVAKFVNMSDEIPHDVV